MTKLHLHWRRARHSVVFSSAVTD